MATIQDIINSLEAKIIETEQANYVNVVTRLDGIMAYLKDLLAQAKGEQEAQKFDLVQSISDKSTISSNYINSDFHLLNEIESDDNLIDKSLRVKGSIFLK